MKKQQLYNLQVIIASGPESVERAVLGFALAVSAAVSGVKVMVILALQGVAWAERNIPAAKRRVNGFSTIREYISILKDNGAVFRLCSSCVENNCKIDRVELSTSRTYSYVGLTEVAIQAIQDATKTIVF